MSVPQRFNDSEYKNWLKCMNAFIILTEALHPFIDTGVNTLHTNVKQNVLSFLSGSNGTIQCQHCSSNNIFYKGATGRNSAKWMIRCPSSVCDVWLDEIVAFHTEPEKRLINWKNSDISKWDTDPYEIAKVFMPKGLDKKTKLPEELDIPAILSLLKYCTYFMKSVPNIRLLTDLIDVRNMLYHSGSFKVPEAQKDKWIDMMSQLVLDLNLSVTLHNDLCMLKTEEISIQFEEMETRALMNMVTLLQGDIEAVKNKMASTQETQSQLSMQTQNNMDEINDTRMKTDTLEKNLKEMKPVLIELTNASDKIIVFLENNDIKDKDLLGVVGSNEKNINELRSRQCEVETNILDIKSELSSVKEQVGKNKEVLEQLEGTVETNEREVERYKNKRRIRSCCVQIYFSGMVFIYTVMIAGLFIPLCSKTLQPILGDWVNRMMAALITTTVFGIYCFVLTIWMHIICIKENESELRRLLFRNGPILLGCILSITNLICVIRARQFIDNEAMNGLTEKIKRTYVSDLHADEPFSAAFDRFQIENQCCWVKDYTDLQNATKWNRTFSSTNDTMMIPPSCCKMKPETLQPRSAQWMYLIDGSESNKDKPCYDHIKGVYNNIMQFVMLASLLEAIMLMILSYDDSGLIYDIIGKFRCYCVGNKYQRM